MFGMVFNSVGTPRTGGTAYIVGGLTNSSGSKYIQKFNGQTSSAQLSQYLTANTSENAVSFSLGSLFNFGGNASTTGTYTLNNSVQQISKTAVSNAGSISSSRCGISACSRDDLIFLFGGKTSASAFSSTIQRYYNGTTNTQGQTLASAAAGQSSEILGSDIYVFGGQTGASTYSNAIQKYDSGLAISTLGTNLSWDFYYNPVSKAYFGPSPGSKVYLFTGANTVKSFDGTTVAIASSFQDIYTNVQGGACAEALDINIYLFGGVTQQSGGAYVNTIYAYNDSYCRAHSTTLVTNAFKAGSGVF